MLGDFDSFRFYTGKLYEKHKNFAYLKFNYQAHNIVLVVSLILYQ